MSKSSTVFNLDNPANHQELTALVSSIRQSRQPGAPNLPFDTTVYAIMFDTAKVEELSSAIDKTVESVKHDGLVQIVTLKSRAGIPGFLQKVKAPGAKVLYID